jgi:hypothetical protein
VRVAYQDRKLNINVADTRVKSRSRGCSETFSVINPRQT